METKRAKDTRVIRINTDGDPVAYINARAKVLMAEFESLPGPVAQRIEVARQKDLRRRGAPQGERDIADIILYDLPIFSWPEKVGSEQ